MVSQRKKRRTWRSIQCLLFAFMVKLIAWNELCLPKIHMWEALIPSVTVFGETALKEVIKVK